MRNRVVWVVAIMRSLVSGQMPKERAFFDSHRPAKPTRSASLPLGTTKQSCGQIRGIHENAQRPGDPHRPIAYDGGRDVPHPPAAARAALDRLIAGDPDLAGIEARAGPLPWRTRAPGFPGLLQAIVAQQISNQAAAAIWGRLRAVGGALEPAGMLALSDEVLRAAGLSRPKVAHARALAAAFLDHTLDPDAIAAMDDETAVADDRRGARPWALDRGGLSAVRSRPA